jgi:hypothetical protein
MSLTPDQRKAVRTIIGNYLTQCEANRSRIHYSQFRPLTALGDDPKRGFTTDCSGLVICAFYRAELFTKNYRVKDPGGYAYSGWGYTGSILATNKSRRVPLDRKFFIGDMALFGRHLGATSHVTICRRGGGTMDSIWTSHGSESGPVPTRLRYRSDLLCVVRAESLA